MGTPSAAADEKREREREKVAFARFELMANRFFGSIPWKKKVICDQIETFTNSTLCKTVSILELALTRVLSLDLINLSRIIIFSITKTHKIYFTFIIIYFVHFSK